MKNSREIFTSIFSGERPEYIPMSGLWPWAETLERWRTEGCPADQDHNAVLGLISPRQEQGISLPLNLNMAPTFPLTLLELDDEYATLIDEYGVTKRCLRRDFDRSGGLKGSAGAMSAMSQWLDFPVKDLRSWKDIYEERFQSALDGRLPADWDEAAHTRQAKTRWVGFFCFPLCGLFGPMRELMGVEGLLYAMVDTPELVHTIVQDLTDFWLATFAQLLPRIRLDQITFFEDMCATKAPLIGPAMFCEFLTPGYRKAIGGLRSLGVREFWMDTDGNAWDILPDIIDCGFTGVSPCEAQAAMDIARLRNAFPTLNLAGGVDKRALVIGPAAIDAEVDAKMALAWERGRYIPSLDHGAPPDIPWAHACHYAQRYIPWCAQPQQATHEFVLPEQS